MENISCSCLNNKKKGWGHGLEVIEKLAAAAGIQIQPLGLLQPSERISAACRLWHFCGF